MKKVRCAFCEMVVRLRVMPEIIARLEAIIESLSQFVSCDQFPVCVGMNCVPLDIQVLCLDWLRDTDVSKDLVLTDTSKHG